MNVYTPTVVYPPNSLLRQNHTERIITQLCTRGHVGGTLSVNAKSGLKCGNLKILVSDLSTL